MKRFYAVILVTGFLDALLLSPAHAESIASLVSGKILLDVESHGEAWYVYPPTLERYYLEDGDAAYAALETFGLGITDEDLSKIPIGIESRFELADADGDLLPDAVEASLGTDPEEADSDNDGHADGSEVQNGFNPLGAGEVVTDAEITNRLLGRILLQVEASGEAWYVYPADAKRYYLGNGEAAYQIMRYVSLGITSDNLAQVPIMATSPQPTVASAYYSYSIATDEGSFSIKVVTLLRDDFEMVTDTGDVSDCTDDCTASPLATYVLDNNAFAGIHGTYFCPPDYAACASSTYSYYPPVFNSALGRMMNDEGLNFHARPIIVQTTDGEMHYFHRAEDFGDSLEDFEDSTGLRVSAAIGNWPSLVEEGESVVDDEPVESSFANLGTRGGIGWDDEYFYLVIASSASVDNLAAVFETLGVDYAMNLDGGGSAALYYDGAYKVGPGRLLPNAILFRAK